MTYDEVRALYVAKGYKFYDSGKYNVNLFGIRNKDLTIVDKFNDILGVVYLDEFSNKQCLIFDGTTKPGLSYLKDTHGNPNGTAIVCSGQYPGVWMIGYHHRGQANQYEAYEQKGKFNVWRDANKDGLFTVNGKVYTDGTGINGHHAAIGESSNVANWSSACQVVQSDKEHAIWLNVGKRSAELYSNSFTYTLFQQ